MIRPLWKELQSSEVAKLLLITGGSVQSCCTLEYSIEYSKIGMMLPPASGLLVETINHDFSQHSGMVAPLLCGHFGPLYRVVLRYNPRRNYTAMLWKITMYCLNQQSQSRGGAPFQFCCTLEYKNIWRRLLRDCPEGWVTNFDLAPRLCVPFRDDSANTKPFGYLSLGSE